MGVADDKPFDSSLSAPSFSASLSFTLSTTGDVVTEVSALPPRLPFPGGGGFTANSCAPGIGGGRNEDEGEGKGDEEGGVSTWRDKRGWMREGSTKRVVSAVVITKQKGFAYLVILRPQQTPFTILSGALRCELSF